MRSPGRGIAALVLLPFLASCGAPAPQTAPAAGGVPTAAQASATARPAATTAPAASAPASSAAGGMPAFTGAEGAGASARGGRGGDVYRVTSLADSGAGSLRNGIASATGPRTIVFDVTGTIELTSRLLINRPFLTIAGQTAPGEGITIKGWNTTIANTNDVVVRYVRFRPGDTACPRLQDDALSVDKSKDVILDHVSASWSVDEALSVTDSDRVTVQWSIISESMRSSCHEKGAHGYGSLLRYGSGAVTFHHNLFAHHDSRNPRVGDELRVDFVNNVVYDWGNESGYSGEESEGTTRLNYAGNYAVAGPSTRDARRNSVFSGGSAKTLVFQTGNLIDSNRNRVRDGTDTGWSMFRGSFTRQETRFELPQVRMEDARTAYERVLAGAGASRARDAVDQRIVADVTNETGGLIDSQNQVGGWPTLAAAAGPKDTDGDGMPDEWEAQNGLSPTDPADRNRDAGGGQTFLEKYLDSLAA